MIATTTTLLHRELQTLLDALTAWAALELPAIVSGVVLFTAGWWFAGRLRRAVEKLLDRQTRVDATLRGAISALVHHGVVVLVSVAALAQLGIQTTSILAALGAAGLAIGLALQGTLSNIAAGLMLLWLRPFRVGDQIEIGAFAGVVKEVGLFASEIHTMDGIYQFVPNSELWNKRIINYTRLKSRMVDIKFGIGYGDDIARGKTALVAAAAEDARVLPEPAPTIFVDELADSAVMLRLRVWTATADYWPVRRALVERGKLALDAAGLSIPFPQRELHLRGMPSAHALDGAQ